MCKYMSKSIAVPIVWSMAFFSAINLMADVDTAQVKLEYLLRHGCSPSDNDDEEEYVPWRNRDALSEFQGFISRYGWTTNQFVEGLMFAVTNNMTPERWQSDDNRHVASTAVWKLTEINLPQVTNFFRAFNERDGAEWKVITIPAMFAYTDLEPEVISYIQTLCIRTNIFDNVSDIVLFDMLETLKSMSDELQSAATNRVAKYTYFATRHTTTAPSYHDKTLLSLLPSYSNSIQRLSSMQHVAATATNAYERTYAQNVVQSLSAVPTNELNNITWLDD